MVSYSQVRSLEILSMKNEMPETNCHIEQLVQMLAGRWKLLIIFWLVQGPCRFNSLQRKLGLITHRTLARQLNELADVGFVERKDFKTVPPHVEYSLTDLGHSFIPVLKTMHEWAVEHGSEIK